MNNKCQKEIIKSDGLPQPISQYSIGIKACHFLFVSGQLGLDPKTGELVEGGIENQTRQSLLNIDEILKSANSDLSQVVKITVFLNDIKDLGAMNSIYKEFFKVDPPARSSVQVAALPKNGLVEIEAIAFVDHKCD